MTVLLVSSCISNATNTGELLYNGLTRKMNRLPLISRLTIVIVPVMDIIGFLPPSSELNASAFKLWNKDPLSVRLGLSITHSVHGTLAGRDVEGKSDLTYVIEGSLKCDNLAASLEVSNDACYVGVQSPDLIRALMEELRPRTSYSVSSVSNGLFDLRGLAYVLGVAVAAGSNNAEFNFDRGLASIKLLSPSWSVPVASELTIGPGIAASSREYVTLAYLAYASGIKTLQLMADLIPDRSARPLQGTELAGFALKLASNVFSVSQSCACAGHHMQAFFRGMTASWSLWAHSDEGGWMRRALANAMYPPGAGIMAVTTEEFMSLPLRHRIASEDVTKYAVGLYLTFAGLVAVADSAKSGYPTVFEKNDIGGDDRPSNFEGLHERTYEVMATWRRLVSDRFSLHQCSIWDEHSFAPFFLGDRVDRHLAHEAVIPFWWVEPMPLVTGDTGKLYMPATRGEHTTIPFCGYDDLLHPDIPPHRRGTFPAGTPVKLKFGPGGLRDRGYSYLLSGAYRRENGLGFMEQTVAPELGAYTTDAMFVAPGVTDCATRRWFTPHNPLPNPLEGYCVAANVVTYTYAGLGSDPSLQDWASGAVESLLGFFRLNSSPTKPVTTTHHSVPPAARRFTRWMDQRVDDPLRFVSVKNETKVREDPPLAVVLEPAPPMPALPASKRATVPVPDACPPPPKQADVLTMPLDPNVGQKPGVKTDGGGSS